MGKPAETLSGLQPYPAYKPSAVEWLETVPAHWEEGRLGNSVQGCIAGIWGSDPNGRDDLICVRVADFDRPRLRIRLTRPTLRAVTHSERRQRLLTKGDLLLEKSGGGDLQPVGAVMLYDHDDVAVCSNFVARMPVSSRCNGRFFVYLHAHLYAIRLTVRSIKQTTGIQNLSSSSYLNETVAFPPLPEQAAIARYLDHADRRIRRCIQAKEKLVKLLEEQRQAFVNEAVTGRVDVRSGQPYLAYKPSGVEWLGKVPTHWVVASLRHRYQQCLGKMLDTKHISGEHLFPYLRNTDVQWDEINVADLPKMDIRPVEVGRYTVRRGDLLVCEGGEVGRCAIWDGDSRVVGYQKAIHRLRPHRKDRDIPRFMYYALRSATERGAFDDGHESTIRHLTGDKLRAHRFPFPPFSEQSTIANYLDHTDQLVRRNIRASMRQIHLLEECRTRLIADLVTGKLDVREAASQLPNVIGVTKSSTEPDAPAKIDPAPANGLGASAWEPET